MPFPLPNEVLDMAASNLAFEDFLSMRRALDEELNQNLDTGPRVVKVGRVLFPFGEY